MIVLLPPLGDFGFIERELPVLYDLIIGKPMAFNEMPDRIF